MQGSLQPATERPTAPEQPPLGDFLRWLVAQGRLSPLLAERVTKVHADTRDRLSHVLLKLGLFSESDLAAELSSYCHLPQVAMEALPRSPLTACELNEQFLRTQEVVPVALDEHGLQIACWDALDENTPRALVFALGRPVRRLVATRAAILDALQSCYPDGTDDVGTSAAETSGVEEEEVDRLKDLASDAPVIRLVQRLITEAVTARASDIHIEPSEHALHVRYRMDGILREMPSRSRELAAPVVSRIKVISGLDIAERRLPQDGRIRATVHGSEVDFRVATAPTLHGESAVLRILDRQDVSLDFSALGFDTSLQSALREVIARPYGIVLVTGPTGSGKTTTLYAALKEINTPEKKILTVEDPVEYVLAGVNQVQIRPQIGLTFAHALRSFLRQDPDVLMVGEIRDRETAEIAIQAALTGHLLLSTLHTNTAAAAVARLLDMGIDDYLLTSTLHIVLGQRLLRRLCTECRTPYAPSADVRARFKISAAFDGPWYRASGCEACQGSGFRGRTAIVEAMRMTDAVRAKVLARADAYTLERTAVEEGMRTMLQHGVERVCAGSTTLEELLRVTSLG